MDIAIVGRHARISDEFRAHIEGKFEKVTALAPRATRAEIHVVHERNPRLNHECERIEITVHDKGVVRTEASSSDRYLALDQAIAKMVERLRKRHERKVHRQQAKVGLHSLDVVDTAALVTEGAEDFEPVSVEEWEGAPVGSVVEIPLDGTPITIRSKRHEAAPMKVADAIDQMELVGHDFYLFHDVDSELPSAVYRRRGWTYGVIHLGMVDGAELAANLEEAASA